MPTYRYRAISLDASELARKVPGAPVLGLTGPDQFVDIVAPAGSKADLDEYMTSQGYSYDSTNPATPPAQQGAASVMLRNLGDVSVPAPTSNQVLSFNGAVWVDRILSLSGIGNPNVLLVTAPAGTQYRDNGSGVVYLNSNSTPTGWVVA